MRAVIYSTLGIIGIILVTVMLMTLTSVSKVTQDLESDITKYGIKEYIPVTSTVWTYGDAQNFQKIMATEHVYQSNQYIHLIVKGEEDDSSIKSYRRDYGFEYTYKADNKQLKRTLKGNVMIDSFQEVILLQAPLVENNKWSDTWQDLNGRVYKVSSVIKKIENDGEKITVVSVDQANGLTVERIISLGKGVVEVKIKEHYDDIEFETGFKLLAFEFFEVGGFDNYMALLGNEKIGTLIDTIEEAPSAMNGQIDGSSDEEDEQTKEPPILEDEEIDEALQIAIKESIKTFNEKWITFINEDDMAIMETITPNASVEKIIEAYKNKDMIQQFWPWILNVLL